MKALLIVLVVLVAGVVGLGFYRGWFTFASDSADGKSNITLTVDKDKFQEDKEKATEKAQHLGQKAKEKTGASTDQGKEQESRP